MQGRSSADPEVAIIGAGPYGLSVAAHLRRHAVAFRIFGVPMGTWRMAMPKGMFLKSEGAASNLSDPDGSWTLEQFCTEAGQPYNDIGAPVALETFAQYGVSFQRRLVPEVEGTAVVALTRPSRCFEVRLETGETFRTPNVVLAVGTTYFDHLPKPLANLPAELLSHSSRHSDLGKFRGREVVVIGRGQSALETAALIQELGGRARILVRAPSIIWHGPPSRMSLSQRLRQPNTGLGRGWRNWFYCNGPSAFQYFPPDLRLWIVGRALGPAGAWWLKDRVIGHIPVMLGHALEEARADQDRVHLRVVANGGSKELFADHV